MGYWWPPSLYAFDPTDRPLIYVRDPQPSPSELDLEFLQCLDTRTAFVKKNGLKNTYYHLASMRTPGDPPEGGLAADTVNEDGSLTINYWDFSDENKIRRKRVRYIQDKKTGASKIDNYGGVPEEWDRVDGKWTWRQEGPDAEREFGKSGSEILSVIGTIAASVMALTGVGAVAAGAFASVWSFTIRQLKNHGRPPSLDEIMSLYGEIGKAVGPGVWSVVTKNPGVQKMFNDGWIAEMSKKPGEYKDKLAASVNEIGGLLPRLPMRELYPLGGPQFDVTAWAAGALKKLPIPALSEIKFTTSSISPFGKREQDTITLSELHTDDVRRSAWAPAARAFAEPDPTKRAQIRRNFLWCNVPNSSAITAGEPLSLGARGGFFEEGEGLMNAGATFDQYLATLLANALRGVESSALGVISASEGLQRADPKARKVLYEVVSDLRDRYRMT
jgi:hypothetical protein